MAGSAENINDLVGKQAFDQLTKLKDELDGRAKQIVELNKMSINLETKMGESKSLKDVVINSQALADVQARFNEVIKQTNQTMKDYNALKAENNGSTDKMIDGANKLSKARAEEAKALREISKATTESEKAKLAKLRTDQAGEAAAKREARTTKELTDERLSLNRALKEQEVRYGNLYITQGKNHPLTVAAKDDVLKTRAVLDDVNNSIGRYTDNVGNYAGGFGKAANSLNSLSQTFRNSGNEIDALARILGFSKGTVDDFRIALEHSTKSLAGFFAIFAKRAEVMAADTEATIANTAANEANAAASGGTAAVESIQAELSATEALTEVQEVATQVQDAANTATELSEKAKEAAAAANELLTGTQAETTAATIANTEATAANIVAESASVASSAEVLAAEEAVAAILAAETLDTDALSTAIVELAVARATLERGTLPLVVEETELAAATVIQTVAAESAAVAEGELAAATVVLTATQKALRIALITTGIGALIALIALVVIAYKEWHEATESARLSQAALAKAIESTDYHTAIEDISKLTANVKLARQGLLDKTQVVDQYNDSLGKAAGAVKDLDGVEQGLNKHKDAYIQMMIYKAAAVEAYKEAADEAVKAEKLLSQQGTDGNLLDQLVGSTQFFGNTKAAADSRRNKEAQDAQKQSNKLLKIADEFNRKMAQGAKDNGLDSGLTQTPDKKPKKEKAQKDTFNSELKSATELIEAKAQEESKGELLQAEIQKGIADDEKRSLADRIAAYAEYSRHRLESAAVLADAEMAVNDEKLDEIRKIEAKGDKDRTDAEKNLLLNKSLFIQRQKNITAQFNIDVAKLTNDNSKFVADISEKELRRVEKAAKDAAKNLHDVADFNKERNKGKSQTLDEYEKKQAQQRDYYVRAGSETSQSVASINSALAEKRIKEIDAEITALNKRRDAEIEAIEKSSRTQQEKDKATADIKVKYQAQEDELDLKKRQKQRRAAIFEKAITVGQVIAETTLAITRALSDKTVPYPVRVGYAISAGAIGTLQSAAAALAPIPEYMDGTEDHPGGPAMVHKDEVVRNPDGSIWYTGSAKETFVPDLPKHAQVYPSIQDFVNMTYGMTLPQGVVVPEYKETKPDPQTLHALKDIRSAIENQKGTVLYGVNSKYQQYIIQNVKS